MELKSFTVEPEVVRLGGSARYTAMTYCPTGRMIEVAFVTKRGETVVDAPKYSRVSNCSGGVVSSNNGGYVFSNSLESLGEYTVTVTVYDQNAGVTVSDTKPLTVIP
ncbi:MAG: hypothetical protein HYT62_05055 [Candidatus Yanofskybacteria bacterium]|nr:hypothetical protein [Candidatus Yanofskybacteria bacterium]